MKTRVKICGVTRPHDAVLAADCGAWAVGMIFVPGTPRFLTAEAAGDIAAALPRGVLKVGVFRDATLEEVKRIDAAVGLDLLQLHGSEPDLYIKALGAERCVKAVFLAGPQGLRLALKSAAATLLADRSPGTARADFSLAAQLAAGRERVLLAGGLTPDSVGRALREVRPWGVDVSSGVESAPGVKDAALLRNFFDAVLQEEAV